MPIDVKGLVLISVQLYFNVKRQYQKVNKKIAVEK